MDIKLPNIIDAEYKEITPSKNEVVPKQEDIIGQVSLDELRKRSIFLATPMYGGLCYGQYCNSVNQLHVKCMQLGIKLQSYFLFNESLIQRARNYCVDEFLRSDCSHLLFIDADIRFDAQSVIDMLILSAEDSDYDVLCGPYPKKCIAWEKIKLAVDKGIADKDPTVLSHFVGDYVFNPVLDPGVTKAELPINRPFQIAEGGTGFMLIKRSVFDRYREAYPEYAYRPDHVRQAHFDGTREIWAYFDCEIDKDSKRYLSEDYMFCRNVRNMGGKIWLCPWISLGHNGTMEFGGSLAAIASIGASPTVSQDVLDSRHKK